MHENVVLHTVALVDKGLKGLEDPIFLYSGSEKVFGRVGAYKVIGEMLITNIYIYIYIYVCMSICIYIYI